MKTRMFVCLLTVISFTMILHAQVLFDTVNANILGYTADWYSNNSSVSWGDFDNDGDLDILLTGTLSGGIVKVLRNDTNDVFTDIGVTFSGCNGQAAIWLDYDKDGDLDIFATSQDGFIVFQNSDNWSFSQTMAITGHPAASHIGWIDFDNDGDADIVLASNGVHIFEYTNGVYSYRVEVAGLNNVKSMRFCDIDNDGDTDIIVSGGKDVVYSGDYGSIVVEQFFTQIICNDNSTFVCEMEIPDYKVSYIDLGDYNSDGNIEIIMGGEEYMIEPDGMGGYFYSPMGEVVRKYSHLTGLSSLGVEYFGNPTWGSVQSGDLNNDGQLDFVGSGWYYMNGQFVDATRIFLSNGNQIIENLLSYSGVSNSKIDFGDYNNDGKLDFIVTGRGVEINQPATFLFKNSSMIVSNTNPNPPINLRTENEGDYIKLVWNMATDNETPSMGLTYNIRIGTSPGGHDIMSSMSANDGSRLVSGKGLVNGNCFWKIHKSALQTGNDYYWSVQAIDNNYKGSAFSTSCLIPLPEPQIELVSSESVNFGNIYIGTSSDWLPIEFRSTGLGLIVSDVYLKHNSACFQIDQSSLGNLDEFGSLGSILVMFSPESLNVYVDTLRIISNAVNLPIIEIRLSGNSVYIPPQSPENLTINITDSDVLLSWQAVNNDVLGHPITPDGYVILYNEIPNDDQHFWFLGFSESTNFTHHYVNIYRDSMFYKVVAVIYYRDGMLNILKDLNESKVKYPWKQVKEILSDS